MLTITKEFLFDAAHKLERKDLSPEENQKLYGKCNQFHGHTYRLQASVPGPVGPDGMIMNFCALKKIVNETFINRYDHALLNEMEEFRDTPVTAENMVMHMFKVLEPLLEEKQVQLEAVTLYETPTSWAAMTR